MTNNLKWKISNANYLKKIGYALTGLKHAFVSDKSARTVISIVVIHILVSLLFVPTIFFKSLIIGFAIIWLSIELLNTSIEATVDRIGLKYHILSKNAKDLAAGAGLIAEIGVLITSILVIIHSYKEYKKWKNIEDNNDKSLIEYIKWTYNVE
tara:strand:- start:911 stop:1369 length:459 start_codon:yes stop_codon:yes gene_type:complete